jgi:hypothetical protein
MQGTMKPRLCPTEMIIYVLVDLSIRKVFVLLRHAHNHPVHPKSKPTSADKAKLAEAVDAAGKIGLTAHKLINGAYICDMWRCLMHWLMVYFLVLAASTSLVYGEKSVGEVSPAFVDKRKVRDAIKVEKAKDYPEGMGWEGV